MSAVAAEAPPHVTEEELAWVDWQLMIPGFGLEKQYKLKGSTALVSRVGGGISRNATC